MSIKSDSIDDEEVVSLQLDQVSVGHPKVIRVSKHMEFFKTFVITTIIIVLLYDCALHRLGLAQCVREI